MPLDPFAELSLELNAPQDEIRDFLDRQGLSATDTGTLAALRSYFADHIHNEKVWTLRPGDTVRRRSVHRAFGGGWQGGIAPSANTPNIFIFSDQRRGAAHGYDTHEGLQPDGSFAYTGEGQRGPQTFTRGNAAVRDSARDGKVIRVFLANSPLATYVGAFTTGAPTYKIEVTPDTDRNPREAIIFNLVPIDADAELLAPPPSLVEPTVANWYPPEASDVTIASGESPLLEERTLSRFEFELQSAFGSWLHSIGEEPKRLLLPVDGTTVEPDVYVASKGWVVEAKKSTGRDYVRMAIGQVLDYVHIASSRGLKAVPVILLPGLPSLSLMALIKANGIVLAVADSAGFRIIEP